MSKDKKKIVLEYIGKGDYIIGIPARDLTEDEVEGHDKDRLIISGLYREPAKKKGKREDS